MPTNGYGNKAQVLLHLNFMSVKCYTNNKSPITIKFPAKEGSQLAAFKAVRWCLMRWCYLRKWGKKSYDSSLLDGPTRSNAQPDQVCN